eukprot:Nitzschia sp. Nitz4//scaffold45_size130396//72961//74076//NITZ4_003455-RA/size130396-exonerate_est2genome-gene-0.63-mRNA-1//1//CDS//3329552416//4856//frame0
MKLSFVATFVLLVVGCDKVTATTLRGGAKPLKVVAEHGRFLQTLDYVGSNPTGLSQCEGDCDSDSDCSGSLICYQKDGGSPGTVPGCSGTDFSRTDFCIDPSDVGSSPTSPVSSPVTSPTPAPVPSSSGTNALFNYGADPPSSVLPLGVCEGDCDSDSDCSGNLYCLQRGSNAGSVPGCSGSDASRTDYCVAPNSSPVSSPTPAPATPTASAPTSITQNFFLKLYWEEGYYWQEESFERKWCMRCRSGSCSLGDKLYVEECSDSGVQRFDFNYVSSDEVLIKLHGTSRCLQRQSRDIFVRTCDSSNSLQKWETRQGEFDEYRFEISQKSATNLCITQRHHPKPDEEVELEPCSTARISDTSYWERCYSANC